LKKREEQESLKEAGLNRQQRAAVLAAKAAARSAGSAGRESSDDEGVTMKDSDQETDEAGASPGPTGATPEMNKLGVSVQREIDKEGRTIEAEIKRTAQINAIPEEFNIAKDEQETESDRARLERLKKKRNEETQDTKPRSEMLVEQRVELAITQAKSALQLAQTTMKLTERELDRIAKESLKVVSNKGMDYTAWQEKIKQVREIQFHEDMLDIREVKKGDKTVPFAELKILNIVPHGKNLLLHMAKPETRQELVGKLVPLLTRIDCHLMTPSSESKETMCAPSRAAYKFITKGLKRDDIKGQIFTSGPEDLTVPCWSISFAGEMLVRCDTEQHSSTGGLVSRIRLLKDMTIYGKQVDLEAMIRSMFEDVGRYAPHYPWEMTFVYAKGPLKTAPGKGKGKGKDKAKS